MRSRAALALFTVLALLSGCDDMTVQPKAGAWSPAGQAGDAGPGHRCMG